MSRLFHGFTRKHIEVRRKDTKGFFFRKRILIFRLSARGRVESGKSVPPCTDLTNLSVQDRVLAGENLSLFFSVSTEIMKIKTIN